ncbi:hypothetical protein GCM10007966_13270 [Legionella impletisoli]|uniref:Transmembrane protein n=2 Tax=Legionella impletisoli TaxID=343510 RepID=A0A917JTC5_9GAMM|nr:hypothetical protein GCM10007966_13270 [Legionella impletisoli]
MNGIDDTSGLKQSLKAGFVGLGISGFGVALFTLTSLIAAPVWITVLSTAIFAGSVTYLSALLYGVVNDLFATKSNLSYFLLGHQPQQHSMLRTNDPIAQGIGWGIAATFGPALIASILFAISVAIMASFIPVATFILPITLLAMPLIALGAELFARNKAKEYCEKGYGIEIEDEDHKKKNVYIPLDHLPLGSNEYQREGLRNATKEEKATWLANSDRNLFGFTKVPLIGLGVLVALITLSCLSPILPVALFSPLAAMIIPVALAAFTVLTLVAGGIYLHVNRNKQLPNQLKLEFDDGSKSFVDHHDRKKGLVQHTTAHHPEEPGHFPSPIHVHVSAASLPMSESNRALTASI